MAVSPCDAIAERIYEFLDGELSANAEAEVREHLAQCRACASAAVRDGAFLRFLHRRSSVTPAPPALRARVLAMLAAARATAGAPDSAPGGDDVAGNGGAPRRGPDWPSDQ